VNSPDVQAGRPRDRGRWAWWSLAPFGWATWFGFLIAGARTDSRRLKAYAALWAALATVPFIIDAFAADGDPGDTIVGLSVFVVWFAGIAHAFAVRQRMTTVPDGFDAAARLVQVREELDGFASLEDMGMTLDLDGDTVEDLRGRVVFLPR
jgi:hypothetical protein